MKIKLKHFLFFLAWLVGLMLYVLGVDLVADWLGVPISFS